MSKDISIFGRTICKLEQKRITGGFGPYWEDLPDPDIGIVQED